MKKYRGSCLCGEVSFEIHGEFKGFFLCHCSRCRKETGSAHCANLFSDSAALQWISGEEKARVFRFPNTRFTKAFCEGCGSALPYLRPTGGIVVPAGSLDSELELAPTGHIFMGSKASWDNDLEQAPKFDTLPK